MLSREKFERMAGRLGREAREHPRRYRVRVVLWGMLGYGYMAAVLLILLAWLLLLVRLFAADEGSAVLVIEVGAPVAILWIAALKALWIRIPPPEGIALTPAVAPRLFDDVERIRDRLDTAPVHHVLATTDFNASLAQVPRLGMFGWHRNYLVVGLPLLWALTPDEFRGVLAHELGHLSRAHGRTSAWIYRLRGRWTRMLHELKENGTRLKFVFERFFEWYAPRFDAHTFALARSHELEADRAAAAVAGPESYEAALKSMAVIGRYLGERYWPEVWERVSTESDPPDGVYAAFAGRLRQPEPPGEREAWLHDALGEETTGVGTHPSLADRLAALGCADPGAVPPWRGASGPAAAEHYLGEGLDDLMARLEEQWRDEAGAPWAARHEHLVHLSERAAELGARAAEGSLSAAEEWERAQALVELQGEEAAAPVVESLVSRGEAVPAARLLMGRILLSRGDEAGLAHLSAAMDGDCELTFAACGLAVDYLERNGRTKETVPYRARFEAYAKELDLARVERKPANLKPRDVLSPHDMAQADLAALVAALRGRRSIVRAYLARKQVKHLPEKPLYVLGVVAGGVWGFLSRKEARATVHWVATQVPFPSNAVIVTLTGRYRKIGRKLKKVPGSKVYVSRG